MSNTINDGGFGPFDFGRELASIEARRAAMSPAEREADAAEQARRLAEFDALVAAGGSNP